MARQITLIPGDGIGPEVAEATLRAVEATGVDVEWERVEAGAKALEDLGQLLPDDVFASLECTRVGLKGPTATPIGGGHPSINVALRKKLGLYVNFRPVCMLPGLTTRSSPPRRALAIFRENTEDLYSGLEHEVIPDVVESLKIITKTASMKIARAAFEYARRERRRKVTAIHKANIMKMSDGLFLKCCRTVAGEFGEIEYTELIVARLHAIGDAAGDVRRAGAAELCMAILFRTWRRDWWAGWASCRARTSATVTRFSKRCTARRRTLREKGWPIRRR